MGRPACFLAAALVVGSHLSASARDGKPEPPKKVPDGVYAVLREGPEEKAVLPLKDGEALVVDRHRYAKPDDKEPPRYLVVRSAPDVPLALAEEPKAVKEGTEVVKVLVKLQPKAADKLERLTAAPAGRKVTIILGGDVVTTHKVREAIKGGEVQITGCAPGVTNYLLEQLQAHRQKE